MPPPVRACQCAACQRREAHPDRQRHHQMNLFLSRLDEQQRRWYLALEADRLGPGADQVLAAITGVDDKTIRRGRAELATDLTERPTEQVRQAGAGRPPIEKKTR